MRSRPASVSRALARVAGGLLAAGLALTGGARAEDAPAPATQAQNAQVPGAPPQANPSQGGPVLPAPSTAPSAGSGQAPLGPTLPTPTGTPDVPAAVPDGAAEAPGSQDLAFGAFQRGQFLTAFREATRRLEADPADAAAMTLLGELSAEGLGVRQDWSKAADWFRLASDRGDPQAAYALAMLKIEGRGTAKDQPGARKLLERAADAVPAAATSLGLMLLGDQRPESDRRAAELFRFAATSLDPDALYAMAIMTRQGRGVTRDLAEAALWMGKAANERNVAAQVEYAIMLFNGEGVRKDEAAAARMFTRAAERGNAVAQNRLARLYAAGRGVPKNLVEAARWNELARRQGLSDAWLDTAVKDLGPDDRKRVDDAVARSLGER